MTEFDRHQQSPGSYTMLKTVSCISWPASLALCLITFIAAADSGWTGYGRVVELVPTAKHYFEVRLDAADNPSGCRASGWYYQNYASRGGHEMFTVLLEALKEDLQARVYVTGVCNINGYSEFSSVGAAR